MSTPLYAAFGALDGKLVPEIEETAWLIRYAVLAWILFALDTAAGGVANLLWRIFCGEFS